MRACWQVANGAAVLLGGAAAALFVCAPVRADSQGIVCWNDDRGVRSCGDHVPPEFARKQRDLYDPRGVLIKSYKAEETPEQRTERERQTREAQAQEQQRENDAFMLETYRNADDLKAVRDSRLQALDTRLALAEKAVQDGDVTLKDLQDRAESERSDGKEPDPVLLAQIRSYESSQAENIRAVAQIKQEREGMASQFERDLQRYLRLKGEAAPAAHTAQVPAAAPH
ncbi:MAG: hypothetical protein P4L83_02645 [Nevskia sp.]|nr:hypothetical protein [Nevskia sp.]